MGGQTPHDRTTKIDQVKTITSNMINWMLKDFNNYVITIILFDHEPTILVENCKITNETCDNIISNIKSITMRGTTNIAAAFEKANKIIDTYMDPAITMSHIFMTDGNPTEGINGDELLTKIKEKKDICNQYIIGFGEDHNMPLLKDIAALQDRNYHFIDSYETCGMVYGEIMYEIIYKYMDSLTIYCNNFMYYNYETNKWTIELNLKNLTFNSQKDFIIKYPHLLSPSVSTNGDQTIINEFDLSANQTVIVNHLWRQKTLELLYMHKQHETTSIILMEFLEKLKKYQCDTDQTDNSLLKILSDDIYIATRIKNTATGNIYLHSRQTSQGEQLSYTSKNVEHLLEDDWENIDSHELSQNSATPFSCDKKHKMIRSISDMPISYSKSAPSVINSRKAPPTLSRANRISGNLAPPPNCRSASVSLNTKQIDAIASPPNCRSAAIALNFE